MVDNPEELRDWHRLFGLVLTDFFTGTPFTVEVERDLSQQQQLLDVVIVRRGDGTIAEPPPDGLDDLADHNLISFKSRHEALDAWAMKELIGHYVAYRKLVSPSPSDLLAEDQFRLYAVCARFPHNLSGQVSLRERQAGVYDCPWGTDVVRVVVAAQLPRQAHNALLHLFSASPGLAAFGRGAYRWRSDQTSRMFGQLFGSLLGEGSGMAFTMEDFIREYIVEPFTKLTPAERRKILRKVPPAALRETLQSLPPEERLEMLQSLPPEERLEGLPPEKRLAGLSAEQIRLYLDQLTTDRPARPRKPRRKK